MGAAQGAGEAWNVVAGVIGAAVGALTTGTVARRQARADAEAAHDREIEERLDRVDREVAEIKTIQREREKNRNVGP